MNSKSLFAALAGGVTLFVLGYLLYAVIFAGFFANNVAAGYMRDMADVNLIAILIGNLFGGLILAIIFGHWGNITGFGAGAKAGAIFGLIVALAVDFITYGTTNGPNLTATLVDPIITAILFALGGGVVAMVLGRGAASES